MDFYMVEMDLMIRNGFNMIGGWIYSYNIDILNLLDLQIDAFQETTTLHISQLREGI